MLLDAVAARLSALAHPTRLRLLHVLFKGQAQTWPVGALVEVVQLPQPTVSRHLRELLDAGLVDVRPQGRERRYALADAQDPLDRALLGSLEAFVATSPEAAKDLERMGSASLAERPTTDPLTSSGSGAGHTLPMDGAQEPERARQANNRVFHALAHERRRVLLDVIERHPGCSAAFAATFVDATRQAVDQHLVVLETAGLVTSKRSGRERRLFYNAVPLQLAYERWTDSMSSPVARQLSALKARVERAHPFAATSGERP